MSVFVVAGGWDYEGHDFDSVRVFATREAADAYAEEIIRGERGSRYDYANVTEQEVK